MKRFIYMFFIFTIVSMLCACGNKKANVLADKPVIDVEDTLYLSTDALFSEYVFNLDRSVNITTSDNEIVQVNNETHSIKALKEGEATVTISYVYFPDVIKEVKVVVSDMNTINISVGEEYKLMLNNIKDVQIDNPEVIESVDLSTIKGIAEGESALIIIDNNDNEIEITVIVKEK